MVSRARNLILEAFVKGFMIKGDAVAQPVELVCVSIARSSMFLRLVLHIKPLDKVDSLIGKSKYGASSIEKTVVLTLILVKKIQI